MSAPKPVSERRRDYRSGRLERGDLDPDPIAQFRRWLAAADDAGAIEPNAMTLATVDADGRVSARMVLCKGVDDRGFAFYTNYESRKARDLAGNPRAALVFWWDLLERQVRVEGTVEKLPREEAEAYFRSRPRGSRLGALASPQSRPLPDREALAARLRELEARYPDTTDIPMPVHWGGFLLRPDALEFWQGRESRLHDRFRYERSGEHWSIARLAP